MAREFEIVREFEVEATPEQYWDAITDNVGAWLWPMEYEPREGGAAPYGGTIAAWDPPHRFIARMDAPAGTAGLEGLEGRPLNQVSHLVEPREDGTSRVCYVHSGIFVDDWDNQYDGADKHTDFYMHTLRQYLIHFPGRSATYAEVHGPEASMDKDSFEVVGRALGLADGTGEGARVRVDLPGGRPAEAVVDYRDQYFIGLRTDDAMYRFFGRNAFGAPVGISVHHFAADAPARQEGIQEAWQSWLIGLFA